MPLVGGGLLQPYADVQYIDRSDRFRIERRKIRPPVKVRYGVIKPKVYYTSVPQTDHAELEIVSLVVRRSALLQKISEYPVKEAERRPWSKVEALKTLIALRSITLTIVAAVRSWRVSVGERAFLHRGENLLLVLRDDMRDLELLDPPIVFGFDIGRRNPFCLPLVTHRASIPVGGKRLLKRDEEEIARRLATISHDERAQILVEHEYLRREEKRDLRRNKQMDRNRPWAFDRWDADRGWMPQPPLPSPTKRLRARPEQPPVERLSRSAAAASPKQARLKQRATPKHRAPSQETPRSRRARLDEEKARRNAVARSGRDAEKQRARRDEEKARKEAVARSKAEAIEERARKKAEAEQLRGAVKRGKKLEPLVVDDAASYVSFDESVGTFAGGPSLDALSASPGAHTVGTLRTFDDSSKHSYK